MEKGVIQFIAKYGGWVAVKKLSVDEKTDPRTVAEFLAGLSTGIDRKVEENLGKVVDLGKLDKVLEEEPSQLGKNKEAVNEALLIAKSPKVNKVVNEICDLGELQKKEKTELQEFCKVYAAKKLLKKVGLRIDYSEIEIPGMKRSKKKGGK